MADHGLSLVSTVHPLDVATLVAAFEALPHGVAILDGDGQVVAANASWSAPLGDPLVASPVGTHILEHLASITDRNGPLAEHLADGIGRVLRLRAPRFELQYEVPTASGAAWFLTAAAALPDGGAVVTHTDTTTHNSVREVLAEMAFHDTLTGLPNRVLVMDRIRTALVRAQRNASSPAVFFIDLDGFKAVNDRHGHLVGDAVLVAAAERLTAAVREGDTCGRWGGDEFVLVIDLTHPAMVRGLIERAQRAFGPPIDVAGHEITIDLSIGVAVSQPRDTVNDLLRRADAAMYEAKRTGVGALVYDEETPIPTLPEPVLHLP